MNSVGVGLISGETARISQQPNKDESFTTQNRRLVHVQRCLNQQQPHDERFKQAGGGGMRIVPTLRKSTSAPLLTSIAPMNPVRAIYDDLLLLRLMRSFAVHQPNEPQFGLTLIHDFLQDNGVDEREKALSTRASELANILSKNKALATILNNPRDAINLVLVGLGHSNVTDLFPKDWHRFLRIARFDKTDTGLRHTLIRDQSHKMYELLKSCSFTNNHDKNALLDIPRSALRTKQDKTGKVLKEKKAILGAGSFGLVVPGLDIVSGKIVAVKKMQATRLARQEFAAAQYVHNMRPEHKNQFVAAKGLVTTRGKTAHTKSYLFSPLVLKPDEDKALFQNLAILAPSGSGKIAAFQAANLSQITLFIKLVQTLEANEYVHSDFKPENIFGERIGDIGELVDRDGKIDIVTAAYTQPGTTSKVPLTDTQFKTFNRFSLGVMLIRSLTGFTTGSKYQLMELKLPSTKFEGRPARGFHPAELLILPTRLRFVEKKREVSINERQLYAYDAAVLSLAKRLLADDRSTVLPENLDLNTELAVLKTKLQLS